MKRNTEKATLKDEEPGRWIVRGAVEDQQEEDLLETKRRSLESWPPTNWVSGPPKPGEAIPETAGVIVMGRARPEPESVKEVKAEPESVKEKLRKRLQRLKGEVERLEKE